MLLPTTALPISPSSGRTIQWFAGSSARTVAGAAPDFNWIPYYGIEMPPIIAVLYLVLFNLVCSFLDYMLNHITALGKCQQGSEKPQKSEKCKSNWAHSLQIIGAFSYCKTNDGIVWDRKWLGGRLHFIQAFSPTAMTRPQWLQWNFLSCSLYTTLPSLSL